MTRQKNAYYRMKEMDVSLDEKARAYCLLRRANLTAHERSDIFITAGGRYKVDTIVMDIAGQYRARCGLT